MVDSKIVSLLRERGPYHSIMEGPYDHFYVGQSDHGSECIVSQYESLNWDYDDGTLTEIVNLKISSGRDDLCLS